MPAPPTLDSLPDPLPGPFNSLSDIPPKTILDPALYFSTLRANPALLPALKPTQPELTAFVEADDVDSFYASLQMIRFKFEHKKLVKKLKDTFASAPTVTPTTSTAASHHSQSTALTSQSTSPRPLQNHAQTSVQGPFGVTYNDPSLAQLTPEERRAVEKQRRIEENLLMAMEFAPENFANVHMLYIRALLNGVPVKIFVDSGAQMTIISKACAERVGLMDLVDSRFTGTAVGVGTNKIIGRIHAAQLTAGSINLLVAACVLESSRVDFILGLEQMMANQMIIDLKHRVLRVDDQSVPFLSEHELPKSHFGALSSASEEEFLAQNQKDHEDTVREYEELMAKAKGKKIGGESSVTTASTSSSAAASNIVKKEPSVTSKASSSTSSSASSSAQPQIQTRPRVNVVSISESEQTAIKAIEDLGLGFSQNDILVALRANENNVDQALSFLFALLEK